MTDVVIDLSNKYLTVTLHGCSECRLWATEDQWLAAWAKELFYRVNHSDEFPEEEYPTETDFGLQDRMVCPRCRFVHSDDDCSSVDEEQVVVRVEREPG